VVTSAGSATAGMINGLPKAATPCCRRMTRPWAPSVTSDVDVATARTLLVCV
jgi:hypothetical protein